jgi:PAS domain S-box-containing protein
MHAAELVLWPFLEEAPFASAMFDREMRYLHASQGWRRDYGLGDRVLRGVSHYDIFPEIPERWKQVHRLALAGEFQQSEEDRFDRADGSVQWLRWQIRPWFESTGVVGGIVICTEDITERKRIEEELRIAKRGLPKKSLISSRRSQTRAGSEKLSVGIPVSRSSLRRCGPSPTPIQRSCFSVKRGPAKN